MPKKNETMKDILTTRLDSSDSLQVNKNNQTPTSDTEDPTKIENAEFGALGDPRASGAKKTDIFNQKVVLLF